MGRGRHASPHHQAEERRRVEKAHHCNGLLLHENAARCERANNIRRNNKNHCGERRRASEHHEQRRAEKGVEEPWMIERVAEFIVSATEIVLNMLEPRQIQTD